MNTIDPDKYYSPSDIIRKKMLPWIGSVMTFIKMLEEDKGKELYKPIIRETPKGHIRHQIKGQTLLDIIKLADEGTLRL